MSETTVKRPPTLAGACVYLGALGAIIAIRAVTLVSTWNADSRADEFDGVFDVIVRDLGATRAGAETGYKVFLTVVAVLAACAVVFAFFTARGDRASRVGLGVTIGIVGVATFLGFVGGGIFFAMVGGLAVAFSARLWTGEIRTYFRTLAGHAPPPPKVVPAPVPVPAAVEQPEAYQQPAAYQHPAFPPPRDRMPKPVSIAAWTAFVGSVLVASVSALGLLSLGIVGNDYEQMMRDSPLSDDFITSSGMSYDELYRSSIAILGVCLALSVGGLLASTLVLVKKHSGDVFLFVMAVVTIIASVPFTLFGVPWAAAAIVCLVQLRKPEAKAWFAAK